MTEPKDLVGSARTARLRYVSPGMPGIQRRRAGQGFLYRYATGDVADNPEVLKRIRSLAIPPAWEEVWICPDPEGHLQATGKDARDRRQYRYHPRWREVREETKYARMILFGKAPPSIRKQVSKDLTLRGLCRRKVLATVVRLLEVSLIRVGNDEYLHEITGSDFTAKDFRTWAGTMLAALALAEFEKFDSQTQANRKAMTR